MVPTSIHNQRSGPLVLALSLTLLGLFACGDQTIGGADRGKALYDTCLPCHGPDALGQAHLEAPSIAGLEEWYIKEQLESFRSGKRGYHYTDLPGQRMRPMARTLLVDSDVADIAKYVASLPVVRPAPTLEGGDVEQGKKIYAELCVNCHGPDAEGKPSEHGPSLTKTHDWYLRTQLLHFMKARRGGADGDKWGLMMMSMASTLKESGLNHVLAYIQTLGNKE